ncbi:hypothetical protein FHS40_000077 [Streptomyces spectabilis]|uniref:Uncharacterized protein n=1 Tax=Streptomyces spectabilis TaxID=68270 RepID=A0A7W8ERW9_STRST|nr:hypothetical protein [Streptomyces spectabilis]
MRLYRQAQLAVARRSLRCRDDALGLGCRRAGRAIASLQRKRIRIHPLAEISDVHVDRVPPQQHDATEKRIAVRCQPIPCNPAAQGRKTIRNQGHCATSRCRSSHVTGAGLGLACQAGISRPRSALRVSGDYRPPSMRWSPTKWGRAWRVGQRDAGNSIPSGPSTCAIRGGLQVPRSPGQEVDPAGTGTRESALPCTTRRDATLRDSLVTRSRESLSDQRRCRLCTGRPTTVERLLFFLGLSNEREALGAGSMSVSW